MPPWPRDSPDEPSAGVYRVVHGALAQAIRLAAARLERRAGYGIGWTAPYWS